LSPDVVPILSRMDYEPFGRPLQTQSPANPQRLLWIGKENDVESSLGDFGARKYDPELGRFTSVDPLWEEMPGSGPFHYCFNNPIMMRDPFGLEPDGFKNQLTDLEWHNSGVEKEEASPLNAESEYSERVKKETIRANKIAWNLQMRDRAAADKAGAGLTFEQAKFWYQFGSGTPLNVNLNTIDFSNVSMREMKGSLIKVDLDNPFTHMRNLNDALVYGTLYLCQVRGNVFRAAYVKEINGCGDYYNFDVKWSDPKSWLFRNPATIAGEIINGMLPFGGSFIYIGGKGYPIYLHGTVTIKP
ncbi:MAG: RHS repeat domain-containing protein, partial [Candidatus Kapaibacterium sp.]